MSGRNRCESRGPRGIRCVLAADHGDSHACGPFAWEDPGGSSPMARGTCDAEIAAARRTPDRASDPENDRP